jgi:thiol-disulfide isomerase/thioredoxin
VFRLPVTRRTAVSRVGARSAGACGMRRDGMRRDGMRRDRVRRDEVRRDEVRRGGVRVVAGAALAAAVVLGAAACDGGGTAQDSAVGNGSSFVQGSYGTTVFAAGSRPQAPQVTAKTLTGAGFRLSADRGSVVVMNFWGSWCPPCRAEAPTLGQLARHFAADGVRFVGVDIRDNPASAEAFDQTFRISYPSLNDPNDLIALDFNGSVPPAGTPATLVIDRTGHIAARIIGPVSYNSAEALLTQVSAEHA